MKNSKKFSIFLVLVILIVILFIISVFTVYSFCFSNRNTEDTNLNNNSNDTSNEIIVNIDNENNTEESVENVENEEKQIDEENNAEVSTSSAYTFSNGETYNIIGTLNIPSLNINYPILEDSSEDLLKLSLTKYWGGNANEVGNLCILGHNYKNSKFFGKLPNIKKNAIINLTDISGRTLEYKVYSTSIVSPEDNTCTSQLTNGNTEITLITCYYENGSKHATKRFVVKARAY